MRFRRFIFVSIVLATVILLYILHQHLLSDYDDISLTPTLKSLSQSASRHKRVLHVAVVACGQRLQETLVMIKSALLFNHSKDLLKFLVFAEDHLIGDFREKLSDWKALLPLEFDFELLHLRFPVNSETEWRTLFKPCAAQRLFLPSVLESVDSLLYVDTDILFLSPVADVWHFFNNFNASQIAALTPEHEDENMGWYNRFARHPYYGKLGVNSGVMLMNLTRMRQFDWETLVLPIYKEYKLRITWGDQDIINILFYYHPERLFVMPCEYNYRPDHCMYMSVCNASAEGIKLMHGNRGYFHASKQPLFHAIYEAVESYQLKTHEYSNFLMPLEETLQEQTVVESACGKMAKEALQVARAIFPNEYDYDS